MEIHVIEGESATTISLKGRFDFQGHQKFRKVVEGLVRAGKSFLSVDLSEVNFIDSSALSMLLLARETCQKAGGSIALIHPQEYVQRVLKLCRFDQLFQVTQ